MNSRKWIRFFFSTLFLGGASTVIIGFLLRWNMYVRIFRDFEMKEIVSISLWLLGVGFMFSVVSQMGFFAYLTLHRFGLNMFRSAMLWNGVQIILLIFVLFDFVYWRSIVFEHGSAAFLTNSIVALILLFIASAVAFIKSKETTKQAFIPALFFMIVATIVEWSPALRVNDHDWMYLMLIPLLLCNAYQMLILHRIVKKEKAA